MAMDVATPAAVVAAVDAAVVATMATAREVMEKEWEGKASEKD